MKVNQEACDLRRLDLFLRGRLPQDFQEDMEAHLQTCTACQEKLDELAGGTRWWSAVREYLGTDGAAALAQTTDPVAPPRPTAVASVLEYLQPSPHPKALGRLGPYDVLDIIGRGGMGVVLKAFDPALHRPVAIKVLAAEYATHGAARQRFAREARAAAAVVHDHVVPVHAVDAENVPPYLVMGYIPGRSLQQRIDATGPLGVKEILRIAMQTAAGLAAAHAQGLVHRDIKPANIMLENGIERVRITDFGLARAVDDASVTQNGALAGTPQYMAPEQARGEAIDQRADFFALGSTMYAMCTGFPPFRASSSVAVLKLVCDTEPASIQSINPDIPDWLEGIIRKLHAKDPAVRFPSAAAVAELLERCLAHVQQPDKQPLPREAAALGNSGEPSPAAPLPMLDRWLLALAACVVLGAGIFAAFRASEGGSQDGSLVMTYAAPYSLDPTISPQDTPVTERTNQIKAGLEELARSLRPVSAEPNTDPVQLLRWRADLLREEIQPHTPSASPDPIFLHGEELRRRMARLRQELTYLLEAPKARK
jgi:serine/threonine-protein kinase